MTFYWHCLELFQLVVWYKEPLCWCWPKLSWKCWVLFQIGVFKQVIESNGKKKLGLIHGTPFTRNATRGQVTIKLSWSCGCSVKETLNFEIWLKNWQPFIFLVKCTCYYSCFSHAQFSCFSLLHSPVSTPTKQRSPHYYVGIVSLLLISGSWMSILQTVTLQRDS